MPVTLEVSLGLRVVFAAVAGALIGLEREIHGHPAGMRTHLMVAVGAASFLILSMYGFGDVLGRDDVVLDPSRVAAQIVSGIGFIGGGAILKYGASIRGLTTAGSLWATAAVGAAFGAGLYVLGAIIGVVIVFSLWPLNWIIDRVRQARASHENVRLVLARLESLTDVYAELQREHVRVLSIHTEQVSKGRYEIELELQVPAGMRNSAVTVLLASLPGIEVAHSSSVQY